jgi:hypothetical protein
MKSRRALKKQPRGLDNNPQVERYYVPEQTAMLAALRAVLGLRRVPAAGKGGKANDGQDEDGSAVPAGLE